MHRRMGFKPTRAREKVTNGPGEIPFGLVWTFAHRVSVVFSSVAFYIEPPESSVLSGGSYARKRVSFLTFASARREAPEEYEDPPFSFPEKSV